MDLRNRFECFCRKSGLDFSVKEHFKLNSEDSCKPGKYDILVSGGLKKEGEIFEYRFSDKKDAMKDFYYFDLWSYLNRKKGNKIIWRKRPELRKTESGEWFVYSRLIIN